MHRALAIVLFAALALSAEASAQQEVRELIGRLGNADPVVRANAACGLRELGDRSAEAIAPLVAMLGDGAPVDAAVCERHWWRNGQPDLTSPGEQAAAALASIGSRAFQPVLAAITSDAWIARRNAAWTLGAIDDPRAVPALSNALKDREPQVRRESAWALGAIDSREAVPALIAALKDSDAEVRSQAAWALGAIDDSRAVESLVAALGDSAPSVRSQSAWALGAIDSRDAVPGLIKALKDTEQKVRRQAAWALGAIDDNRAVDALLDCLKDKDAEVRRQAAWALGVISR